jgi:ubiquitin carboxyl-terminal hydrolase 8
LEKIRIKLAENDALTAEVQHDASIQEVMDKYPPVNVLEPSPTSLYSDRNSLLDDLPSVPKHMPQKVHSTPQTPPATAAPPPPPPQGYMKMPEPLLNTQHLPQHLLPKPQGIQLPTPTNFSLKAITIVDPSQLASWIAKSPKTPQPSVLILDVRPREAFNQGCIKHNWIAQIEPLKLEQK